MVNAFIISIVTAAIPGIIALILPRKKTIKYGIIAYNWVGRILSQKGGPIVKSVSKLGAIIMAVQTTFVDLAFGIYLASKGYSSLETEEKIKEYLQK